MKAFRKRPVEIEAVQWDGTVEAATPIIQWVLDNGGTARYHGERRPLDDPELLLQPACIVIDTMEGSMAAKAGWWIIKGIKGEFYPCEPEVFEGSYYPEGTPDPADLLYDAWTVIANACFSPPVELDWQTAAAEGNEWAIAAIRWRDTWHAFLAVDQEAQAKARYAEALSSGLSDAEAREEGWPTQAPTDG